MPPRRPLRHRLGAALALAALTVLLGGCLRMAERPSGTPRPTPAASPSPSSPPAPTPGPATPTPSPTFAVYTVKSGDNLTSIARRFNTTPRSIAYWNRDTYPSLDPESPHYAPNNLQIGWVLRVLPGGLYSPPPEPVDSGLMVTPVPTEYLGPPTEPPSGEPSAEPSGEPSAGPSAGSGG
jgi:LysM domain